MDSTNPSPGSVFGEDSARALRAAQRVWSAGTWSLVLWVVGTPIVNATLQAPPIVWVVTSAITVFVFVPAFVVSLVASERLRGKASRLAGEHLDYRVNGERAAVPKWLMKRGPASTLKVVAHAKAEEESATAPARPRIADLRAAVPRRTWVVSVTGAILLVLGVLLSIAAGVIAFVAATEPVAISPAALFASALACYAIGYPMMLALARNFGRTNGKTGTGSR
ncbi:hypothetical protein G3T36_02415 [Diaminobutyricibacter tongyongensis]|uniref:Uncharacterized protein n=1 Tax=Leifsonia tongyongensis TaxID=1268043 RepID=A0A6L9XUG3_9MICO|nr:hypothetical protein [Diaminobutyricibacter tongyongensis]NEN04714.1 hypothetical protein [Diaminobutyricibacter tongyongensis]